MPAYWRISLASMFQYRGEIVLWALWGVVYPAVAIAMWSAAVPASPDGHNIQGFAPGDFAAYFLLTMIVGHVCTAWDLYEMGYLVQSGAMSPKLLRPLLPLWESISDNLAYKVLTLTILVPIWLVVALVTHPTFNTTATHLLYGCGALLLASMLNYLWGYNLALAAFWITRTEAMGELWFACTLFFGGRLAPLTILPLPVQWIAAFLPFQWIMWFPAAILTGRLSTDEMNRGLLLQMAWLLGALLMFRIAWGASVKRYSAVGA